MTGQIVSLIREAKDQSKPQLTFGNCPASSGDTQRRTSTTTRLQDEERLMSVLSQVAWQADLSVSQRLSPISPRSFTRRQSADGNRLSAVRQREGHDEGQADRPTSTKRSLGLIGGGSEPVRVNGDVTQDVDAQERRRHRRARKKCRRHHRQQQQTLVNSLTITSGHLSTDVETSSLAVPSL